MHGLIRDRASTLNAEISTWPDKKRLVYVKSDRLLGSTTRYRGPLHCELTPAALQPLIGTVGGIAFKEFVMRDTHNQNCPLCSTPAEYQLIDYDKRKHFRCSTCVEFVITQRAEALLSKAIPQWREKYSAMAKKCEEGKILDIMIPSVQKQEGVANPAIQGEFVLRSTLRL